MCYDALKYAVNFFYALFFTRGRTSSPHVQLFVTLCTVAGNKRSQGNEQTRRHNFSWHNEVEVKG